MSVRKVLFRNKSGYQLSALIDLPLSRGPYPFALFAHVFTGNKNLRSAKEITRALTLNGIGVLRFDFTGLGESEGKFEETNFTSNVEDLEAAASFLSENYAAPSILIGHSLGGLAAIFASSQIHSIKAVATIGAPSYPSHVTHLIKDSIEEIERNGCARVNIAGRTFMIKKQFLDDLNSHDHIKIIRSLKKALLVMHSPQDRIVEIENAANIYTTAKHPKSFITLDGGDHMLSNKEDALYAGQVIASWVQRYIEFPEREKLSTSRQVVVKLTRDDQFTTDILAGRHGFVADEPVSFGGNNFGPTPYELLNASLGACTAMTLQMYARRKKWDLKDVVVHLSHSKETSYSEDVSDMDQNKMRFDRFERVIELEGDLNEEQKLRLMEIADKCPVHRTLMSPQEFATKLEGTESWKVTKG